MLDQRTGTLCDRRRSKADVWVSGVRALPVSAVSERGSNVLAEGPRLGATTDSQLMHIACFLELAELPPARAALRGVRLSRPPTRCPRHVTYLLVA